MKLSSATLAVPRRDPGGTLATLSFGSPRESRDLSSTTLILKFTVGRNIPLPQSWFRAARSRTGFPASWQRRCRSRPACRCWKSRFWWSFSLTRKSPCSLSCTAVAAFMSALNAEMSFGVEIYKPYCPLTLFQFVLNLSSMCPGVPQSVRNLPRSKDVGQD